MDCQQWFKGHCEPIILECRRCGEAFSGYHMCKAMSRKCFYCNNYGHYSKYCQRRNNARTATRHTCSEIPCATKPTKKQQRDIMRLLEFRERKTVCSSLPFHHLSDDEFRSFIRRSQCVSDSKVYYLENSVVSSTRQISSLQEQNRVLHLKAIELNNAVLNEQRRRQSAEDDAHIAVYHAVKEHKTLLDHGNQELSSRDQEIVQLRSDLQEQSAEICDLEREVEKLSQQKQKLYELVLKLENLEGLSVMKVEAIGKEFENITNQFYGGCWSDAPRRRQPCRGCGSINNHHPADCLAKGNECKNCGKPNHFTALCQATASLIPQGADAAEIAFMEEIYSELN